MKKRGCTAPAAHPITTPTPIQSDAPSQPTRRGLQLLFTVPEAATAMSINRSTLYELLLRGELASVKIGRARRIPVRALEVWIAEHVEGAA